MSPPFLTTVSIGAFSTTEAAFVGIEVSAVDALFYAVGKRNKAVKLVIRPQRIVVIDGWSFGFGENIEPEQRLFSVFLLESIRNAVACKSLSALPIAHFADAVFQSTMQLSCPSVTTQSNSPINGLLKPGTLTEKVSATR